jgi:hypothetical protein
MKKKLRRHIKKAKIRINDENNNNLNIGYVNLTAASYVKVYE